MCYSIFFFNDPATTEIYTLSLHDALPISVVRIAAGTLVRQRVVRQDLEPQRGDLLQRGGRDDRRSEEHTSELQSQSNLVCRLLLEKKKHKYTIKQMPPRPIFLLCRLVAST